MANQGFQRHQTSPHVTNNYPALCCCEILGKKVPYDIILANYGISYHYTINEVQHYRTLNLLIIFQIIMSKNSVALLVTTTPQFLIQALIAMFLPLYDSQKCLTLGKSCVDLSLSPNLQELKQFKLLTVIKEAHHNTAFYIQNKI